jgi:hypothetical protein
MTRQAVIPDTFSPDTDRISSDSINDSSVKEWIVKSFEKPVDVKLFTTINLALKTARLEWVEKFCTVGGHILLIRELARVGFHQDAFASNYPYPAPLRVEILRVLSSLVDTAKGSRVLLSFPGVLDILVQCINRSDPEEFALTLDVLLPFLFADGGPKQLYKAFGRYAAGLGLPFPLSVFAQVLTSVKVLPRYDTFFVFLNGLYSYLSNDFTEQQAIAFEIIESKTGSALAALPPEGLKGCEEQMHAWLMSVAADFNESADLFRDRVRCVGLKDLVNGLKEVPGFGSLLMNLFSILRNQSADIAPLIEFLGNFVLRFRKSLISEQIALKANAQLSFDYANSAEAAANQLTIVDPEFIQGNFTYTILNRVYGYIADQDLAEITFPSPVSQLQQDINTLASHNHRLRVKLTRRKARLASVERERAASHDKADERKKRSEEKKAKFQALIDENAALREQNEQLQIKHQELIEIARAIPNEASRGSLVGIEKVLPQRLVDIGRVLSAFSLLTEKVNLAGLTGDSDLGGLLGELGDLLNSLKQERDTIEANVTSLKKTAREEQVAAESEAGQLRDLATRIISELSADGSATTEAAGTSVAVEEEPPLEEPVRLVQWESVNDSPEWSRIRTEEVTVNRTQLTELFRAGEIPEGHILSPFTARQYEIALKKLQHPMDEIVEAVRQEAFWLGEAALLVLLRLPASAQELQNIANFNGDASTLSEPEQFAVGLHRIPDFRGKARGLIELHRFDVAFDVLLQGLAKFNDGLKKLESATSLRRALAVVLRVGKTLNSGSGGSPAAGFSLNDALEFRFVKTNEKGRRLLHVLIPTLVENGVDIVKVKAEADSLIPASRVSLEGILETLRLALVQLAHRRRVPFVVASSQRVREAIGKVQQVQLTRDRITRSFGVREELLKGSGLFSAFIEFANELNRAVKENTAREGKAAAAGSGATTVAAPQATRIEVDETKSRGLHAAMAGTLRAAGGLRAVNPGPAGAEAESENEFAKAFAKVRKIVQ